MTKKRSGEDPPTVEQANWSEEFLAVVMEFGKEHIYKTVNFASSVGISFRQAPGLNVNEGYFTPALRLLAVFTDAGREYNGNVEQTLRRMPQTAGDCIGSVSSRVKHIGDDEIAPALRGDVSFGRGWLEDLAKGLGFSENTDPWLRLIRCADKLAVDGRPTPEGLKKALATLRGPGPEGSSQLAGHDLLDALHDMTYELSRLPEHYPEHVILNDLASALGLGDLVDKTEAHPDDVHRLYAQQPRGLRNVQDLDKTFAAHHRCVVLGDPGSGKSTVLAAAVVRSIEAGKPALFIRLDVLADMDGGRAWGDLQQALQAVIEAGLGSANLAVSSEIRDSLIEKLRTDPNFLLALDGLDEISQPHERNRVEWVMSQVAAQTRAKIILSSRYTGYLRPKFMEKCPELGMAPIESPKDFVEIWFDGNSPVETARALEALEADGLLDLSRVPVVLGFVCFVAEKDHVKTTKSGLYQQYIRLFLEQAWKAHMRPEDEVARIETAVAQVAWHMSTIPKERVPSFPAEEARVDLPDWGDSITRRLLAKNFNGSSHTRELAFRSGLLVAQSSRRVPGEDDQYRWLHRTIHEHLVGRVLSERLENETDNGYYTVQQLALRPTWKVPLEHAAGFMSPAVYRTTLQALADLADSQEHGGLQAPLEIIERISSHAVDKQATRLVIDILFNSWKWFLAPRIDEIEFANYVYEFEDPQSMARKLIEGLSGFASRPLVSPEILDWVSKFEDQFSEEEKYTLERCLYKQQHSQDEVAANRSWIARERDQPDDHRLSIEGEIDAQSAATLLDLAWKGRESHEQLESMVEALKPWEERHPGALVSLFDDRDKTGIFGSIIRFMLDKGNPAHGSVMLTDHRIPAKYAVQAAFEVDPVILEPVLKLSPWASVGAMQIDAVKSGELRIDDEPLGIQKCEAYLEDLLKSADETLGPEAQRVHRWVRAALWAAEHPDELSADLLWSAEAAIYRHPYFGYFYRLYIAPSDPNAEELCKALSILPTSRYETTSEWFIIERAGKFIASIGTLSDSQRVLDAYLKAFQEGRISTEIGINVGNRSFERDDAFQRGRMFLRASRRTWGSSLQAATSVFYNLDILPAYWEHIVATIPRK
jgi:hypothetical protein